MGKNKMRIKIAMLLKPSWKKQKFPIVSIFLMMFVLALFLFSSVVLYDSGKNSVVEEMNRLGFGDFTVWVSNHPKDLVNDISKISEVGTVTEQKIIYAGYEINGKYSDNEGQLMVYEENIPYHFIKENGEKTAKIEIEQGTIYVSCGMQSLYNVKIGDTITFELTRNSGKKKFRIAGYFEDAFMGSSMIDMKSFLINTSDYNQLCKEIQKVNENDRLAKEGAMIHIAKALGRGFSDTEFYQRLIEETELAKYTEFTYHKDSILSYMLLLQNILAGFMIVFSIILFFVCMIITVHSIEMVVIQERKDMAILKTIGLPGKIIQKVYLLLYGSSAVCGIFLGVLPCKWCAGRIAKSMVSSTGMLIDIRVPFEKIIPVLVVLVVWNMFVLWRKTSKILGIHPMQILQETRVKKRVISPIRKKYLSCDIAIREIRANKKKYIALCLISIVLTFFLGIISHMNTWLGRNGEGLMNAFSVAEHDLGVQPFHSSVPMDEIERVIHWYSPITKQYELAMESVTVNGQEYTANILSDAKWFHILKGKAPEGKEILVTDTVVNELDVDIGDFVKVSAAGKMEEYQISGIYQCANGMGNNIGMSTSGYSQIGDITGFIWCKHYILEDGSMRDYAYEYLEKHYKNIDVHTNSWSGLDGIVSIMHWMIAAVYIISAGIMLLTTALLANKMILSEITDLAIYRSMGLPEKKLRLSFALRFFLVAMLGAVMGTVLSALFSDRLIGMVFRSFGIGEFKTAFCLPGSIIPFLTVPLTFIFFAWIFGKKLKTVNMIGLMEQNGGII